MVVGRFAPSPSGRMHLGNVFAAVTAWLNARAAGGAFLLRIEDLDSQRCKPQFTQALMDDLRWLGVTWEEQRVLRQSRRAEAYRQALAVLEQKGLVYPCFCTRADLHAASAPHETDGRSIYTGRCRAIPREEARAKALHQRHALRVTAPDTAYAFTDGIFGPQTGNPARDWGDFIVRRADGAFAYQLAVVTDDAFSGVTQVTRGRDLLASVAPQLFLYEALSQTPPQYTHIPLLLAPDGKRLSKREKSLSMGALRERFSTPEPLLGRLFYLAGLLDREESVSLGELAQEFTLSRLGRGDIFVDEASFLS